jgi:hypothetical protein
LFTYLAHFFNRLFLLRSTSFFILLWIHILYDC